MSPLQIQDIINYIIYKYISALNNVTRAVTLTVMTTEIITTMSVVITGATIPDVASTIIVVVKLIQLQMKFMM